MRVTVPDTERVRDCVGEVVRDGTPVLEVLLFKHLKSSHYCFPSNFVDADEQLPYGLTNDIIVALNNESVRDVAH